MTKTVDFKAKVAEIKAQAEQNVYNIGSQTALFDELLEIANDTNHASEASNYLADMDIYRGEDLYNLALDSISELRELSDDNFAEITEQADVLSQFGKRPDLLDSFVTINPYYEVDEVTSDNTQDLSDALDDLLK